MEKDLIDELIVLIAEAMDVPEEPEPIHLTDRYFDLGRGMVINLTALATVIIEAVREHDRLPERGR